MMQINLPNQCTKTGILTIVTFFVMLWAIYNGLLRPINPKKPHLMNFQVLPIPTFLQPVFPQVWKDNGIHYSRESGLDGWSAGHFVIYFVIGMFYPGHYRTILAISFLCELYEFMFGYKARISDLYVNMLGYYLASRYYRPEPKSWVTKIRHYMCRHTHLFSQSVWILGILLFIVAYVRRDGWV